MDSEEITIKILRDLVGMYDWNMSIYWRRDSYEVTIVMERMYFILSGGEIDLSDVRIIPADWYHQYNMQIVATGKQFWKKS